MVAPFAKKALMNPCVFGVCDVLKNSLAAVAMVALEASSRLTLYVPVLVDENKAPVMDVTTKLFPATNAGLEIGTTWLPVKLATDAPNEPVVV